MPSEEGICTQIHNITADIQRTKYPVIIPLRYPGRSLATGGLTNDSEPQKLLDRLEEFNRFRANCEEIEAVGEVLYFPIDARLDQKKLFQTLLDFTGATGSLDATSGFPRVGRTGKGDCPFNPDKADFQKAVEFYKERVGRVRRALGGA